MESETFTEKALNDNYVEKAIAQMRGLLDDEPCLKEALRILTLAYHFAFFRHKEEFRDFVLKVCSPLPDFIQEAIKAENASSIDWLKLKMLEESTKGSDKND